MRKASRKCRIHDVELEENINWPVFLFWALSLPIYEIILFIYDGPSLFLDYSVGGEIAFYTCWGIFWIIIYLALFDCPVCEEQLREKQLTAKKTASTRNRNATKRSADSPKCEWCGKTLHVPSLSESVTLNTMLISSFAPVTGGLSLLLTPFLASKAWWITCDNSDCPRPTTSFE